MKQISYDRELDFLKGILSQYKIPVHFIKESCSDFPPVDLGLRRLVRPDFDYAKELELLFALVKEKVVYRVSDELFCSYIFMRLPDNSIISVGPFALTEVSHSKLLKYTAEKIINRKWLPFLEKYFSSVPYITNEKAVLAPIGTFASYLWDGDFTLNFFESKALKKFSPLFASEPTNSREEKAFDINIIEKRYEAENLLMQEISKGRTHKVESMLSNFTKSTVEERTAEPTRNAKNYLIILNTVMRKSAEQASVHPIHIDRASSVFAKKIENLRSWEDVSALCREMAISYCQLVKEHSLKGYTATVQKVISRIDYDLTADLSLGAIAQILDINPSYLSTLFKKETGQTLTDFVAKKRIDHAIFLLKSTELTISDVCRLCGIADNNYFAKLFKKHTGKTPIQYRKEYR